MNALYNFLLILFSPFWVPWMVWRARQRKESVDWKQRCGEYRMQMRTGSQRIWIHAVSVGEVVAAMPILKEVRELAPEAEVVLSVTTSSGHQTARDKAEGLYDHLVYFPIDVPRFVLGAMIKVRPAVVAVMETELWMNFLTMAKNFEVTTLVVNGRISDRSFPRSMKVRWFYQAMLRKVDGCLMQSETDASRIRELGAVESSVEVLGNCKFDEATGGTEADPVAWRRELGIADGESVLVIGSTRGEMEEGFVMEALGDDLAGFDRLVWAPRHMERADAIAGAVSKVFGSVAQRSQKETGRVLLLDTYGELSQVYAVADVVVVGGGFDNLGGQNIIQPLAHGKPVIHGEWMQNFRDIAEMARRAGATNEASNPSELRSELAELLGDSKMRTEMGAAAKALVQAQVGASRRYAERIVGALKDDPWPKPKG